MSLSAERDPYKDRGAPARSAGEGEWRARSVPQQKSGELGRLSRGSVYQTVSDGGLCHAAPSTSPHFHGGDTGSKSRWGCHTIPLVRGCGIDSYVGRLAAIGAQ